MRWASQLKALIKLEIHFCLALVYVQDQNQGRNAIDASEAWDGWCGLKRSLDSAYLKIELMDSTVSGQLSRTIDPDRVSHSRSKSQIRRIEASLLKFRNEIQSLRTHSKKYNSNFRISFSFFWKLNKINSFFY